MVPPVTAVAVRCQVLVRNSGAFEITLITLRHQINRSKRHHHRRSLLTVVAHNDSPPGSRAMAPHSSTREIIPGRVPLPSSVRVVRSSWTMSRTSWPRTLNSNPRHTQLDLEQRLHLAATQTVHHRPPVPPVHQRPRNQDSHNNKTLLAELEEDPGRMFLVQSSR